MFSHPTREGQRGIALLLVVSVLTVVAIMGVSFVFSMFLETRAATQFFATTQARYIAEAGVSHARALLEEDRLRSHGDDLTESWASDLAGADVDVDDQPGLEARWWNVQDSANVTLGRYGVVIRDETGKINLNSAGSEGPDLSALLSQAGLPDPQGLAQMIEQARYGADTKPGVALVDDDQDGAIDEADEYQAMALRGDDRRFERLEELLELEGIEVAHLRTLGTFATVYSWDANVSFTGQPRQNVNTATAEELLSVLLAAGVGNPWQLAANLADYTDADMAMSQLTKAVATYEVTTGELLPADWTLESNPVTHYTTTLHGNEPLKWSVSVPSGSFHVFVLGTDGVPVGDVTIAGRTYTQLDHGSYVGLLTITEGLHVQVTCPEAFDQCGFRGLEVVAVQGGSGLQTTPVSVRGIEAIRINEVLVDPRVKLAVQDAIFSVQNSLWVCQQNLCFNSGTGQASWTWGVGSVPAGTYYVRVYGQAGQSVGELTINGRTQSLVHGGRHSEALTISEEQPVTISLGKTPSDGTYYFQELELTVQPDAEYVELINLSDRDVDVSGWLIEGDAVEGRQGRLPSGAVIKAHGVLAAAVDAADQQDGLANTRISFQSVWEPEDAAVVQLEFPGGALSPDADWLKTSVAAGGPARLILRTKEGWLVDEVEYPVTGTLPDAFQSFEKGDPSVIVDGDQDGLDEGWYFSLAPSNTPGRHNNNDGLIELQDNVRIEHDPSEEITVMNRPLDAIGQLAGLPSGNAWQAVASEELAGFVDRLTVDGIRLEPEGHLVEGQEQWQEITDGYEANQQDAEGSWRWDDVPDGSYRLSLYGWSNEQVQVRLPRDTGESSWTPALSTDAQGRLVVGQVSVGPPATDPQTLEMQLRCASASGVCHVTHVRLDPQLVLVGRVNVNTASAEVLRTLPGATETVVEQLLANRPFGNQERKARGIGDLLMGSTLGTLEEDKLERFRQFAHLVTVRSRVFEIISLGTAVDGEQDIATQRIHAIIER